jgi:hypothetical protein
MKQTPVAMSQHAMPASVAGQEAWHCWSELQLDTQTCGFPSAGESFVASLVASLPASDFDASLSGASDAS